MKPDPLPRSDITGATNLMASKGLESSYVKLTIVGKELHQLSYVQMAGFRLHPGPLPEQYRMS